jgi:hypothetical protein
LFLRVGFLGRYDFIDEILHLHFIYPCRQPVQRCYRFTVGEMILYNYVVIGDGISID